MSELPASPTFVLDHRSGPQEVIDLQFLARQAAGLAYGATLRMSSSISASDLVPSGAAVKAVWTGPLGVDVLAEAADYVLHVSAKVWATQIRVAATEQSTVDRVVASFDAQRPQDDPEEISVTIWNQSPDGGAHRTTKRLGARRWVEIGDNYPQVARSALSRLMEKNGVEDGDGRLILLHGEPGTGKTTVVRALMSEWAGWCDVHLVTDPDRLFATSAYLLSVLQAGEKTNTPTLTSPAGPGRWKLVVAEDADAYLRSTARQDAGAALGRLLNTTDGLLAQASRSLVLLTTNEPLCRLHPAITRPGRCLAEIEVGRFGASEAGAWLGDAGSVPPGGATLAELYQLRRSGRAPARALPTGTYL